MDQLQPWRERGRESLSGRVVRRRISYKERERQTREVVNIIFGCECLSGGSD